MGYIFVIAILNLAVGFAVAWHLGRGLRGVSTPLWPSRLPRFKRPVTSASVVERKVEKKPDELPPLRQGDFVLPPASSVDELDMDSLMAGIQTPGHAASADPPADPVDTSPKSPARAAVDGFSNIVRAHQRTLRTHEARLRREGSELDQDLLRDGMAELARVSDEHVERCREALDEIEASRPEGEEFERYARGVAELVKLQAKAVQEMKGVFEHFNTEDPEAATRVLGLVDDLLAANDRIRDSLWTATAAVARSENAIDDYARAAGTDSLTGLLNPIGLEARLLDWWRKDPHRVRSLTLAALDVDELGRLDRQHGHQLIDKALMALAGWLRKDLGGDVALARIAGSRFVLVRTDEEADSTPELVERFRQTIEMLKFVAGAEEIRMTISCAVTSATQQDTCVSLTDRLNEAVGQARRSGRNRTFQHDGVKPTPVVPPNLAVAERTISL